MKGGGSEGSGGGTNVATKQRRKETLEKREIEQEKQKETEAWLAHVNGAGWPRGGSATVRPVSLALALSPSP